MGSKTRNYCFTLNNPTVLEIELIKNYEVKYQCHQEEIGAEGTRHLQGYVQFTNPVGLQGARRFSLRAHFERARGTPLQCIEYCSKPESAVPGTFWETGTRPTGQGARSDLAAVVAAVKSGASNAQVVEDFGEQFVKFHRGLQTLRYVISAKRDFKTTVKWWHGSTGSGKSRAAFDENPDAYWKDPCNKWWDGYDGEECVVIDDYRRDFCTFSALLRLFDRYPLRLESKGGTISFLARTLIITTPKSPTMTWEGRSDEDIEQLTRRIDEVKEFRVNPARQFFNLN